MFELIKKTLFTGVGLAALTKEKAEELAKELANTANLSADKGKEFVDEVVARSEKARKDLEETVQRHVAEQLKRMNVATHEDIATLAERLETLERTLSVRPE
ncbi:MAG: phasin family protein [Phycisphaerae bacterium]|nr:phasin family protein [Phycisphaerae bacterium]